MRILNGLKHRKWPLISFFSFSLIFVFCCFAQADDANMTDVNTINVNTTDADANAQNVSVPVVEETEKEKTIDSVESRGNVYINSEKILSTARSRAGQLFSVSEAEEDAKRIAGLRGVEFAYYSVEPVGEKVKLIFVVKEKIVIQQVTFSGNAKFTDKKLIDQLGFGRGDYLDKFTAKTGAEKLTEFYHKSGYPLAKVDFDDSGIEKGQLSFKINEGQRVKIKKVKFEGNAAIKSRELKQVIKSKPKNFGVFQNYFKQDVLDDDMVALQKAYDRRGYLDTKVIAKTNYIKNRSLIFYFTAHHSLGKGAKTAVVCLLNIVREAASR